MLFNPKPESIILSGDILIVLGQEEQLLALERDMKV